MSAVIWIASVLAYLAITTVAAVPLAFAAAGRPRCQSGSWYREEYCRRHCEKGDWRGSDEPDYSHILVGCGLGLIWPLLIVPALVLYVTKRRVHPRLLTSEQLRALEKEAGIAS